MKKLFLIMFILALTAGYAYSQKNTYLVVSTHTQEECLKNLDEAASTPELLNKIEWGCMSGDHTGYAFIDADNEATVRDMLPQSMKDKAKITKVDKLTKEQIEAFHKQH